MTSPRPPARDQPPPEETEKLRALLISVVAERAWLNSATTIARGPGAQRVHVVITGAVAELALVDLGQVLARRDLPAADLLAALERDGQTFDVLAALAAGHAEAAPGRPREGPPGGGT